jgi:hypothetical protein
MNARIITAALCGATLLLSLAVYAGDKHEGPGGPKKVGRGPNAAEHMGAGRGPGEKPSFADIDTDGDGQVSLEEFKAFRPQHRGDKGRLKAQEAEASGAAEATSDEGAGKDTKAMGDRPKPEDVFARADADGDGYLSEEELGNLHSKMRQRRQGRQAK